MATLTLKRGRAKPLWYGHPWVYSEAVAGVAGEAEPGDVVDVRDDQGRFIGRGFFNPRSQVRARLCTRREEPVDAAFVLARVERARALRRRLGLPSPETDAYRLINSEGDGLPGVVVDVYGDACAVQFTGLGMKRLEAALYDGLTALLAPRTIFEVAAGGFATIEGFASTPRVVRGDERGEVVCREHGAELVVEPLAGQKTGAFLDQRDNRARVAGLSRGARVLDCYTYAGGFSVAALRAGAASAVAVDVSPKALARAQANAARSGVEGRLTAIESDVFRYLEAAPARGFELVVVDPPKFARARKDLEPALKGYRRLNALAIGACAEGGLLATSSCSQLVDEETFERTLAGAALDAGRPLTVLTVSSQGPDHPVPPAFPEGRYLKFLLCRVG